MIAKITQHGQYASVTTILVTVHQTELHENVPDVLLYRAVRNEDRIRDCGVCLAFGHEAQHFSLARCQRTDRIVTASMRHQLADHLRIEHGSPGGNLLYALNKGGDLSDAVFEQVPDASGAGLKEFSGVFGLDILGQDQYRAIGTFPADFKSSAYAFVLETRGHADINDRDVGAVFPDGIDERGTISDAGYDIAVSVNQ